MANNVSIEIQDLNNANSLVTISVDPASLTAAARRVDKLRAVPERFRPALEEVADYVRDTMIPNTFRNEGPGWAQLAKQTQFERQAKGFGPQHPILKRTGDLYHELTERSHPKHIEIIKVGKYARIEIGGSSAKFIQNQTGRGDPGQRLPARPMIPGTGNLPLKREDSERIKEILADAITREVNKS